MTNFAVYEFPFGLLKIGYDDNSIVLLGKVDFVSDYGHKTKLSDKVYREIIEYLKGKRRVFEFPYKLKGTEFQIKVWNELLKIPYGKTRTYKEIAVAINNPKAFRAVGMANNKNPLMILVPCHRVIGSNKKMIGYAGGVDMKMALLNLEKENK